jgi:hypothetical protein
VCAHTKGRNGGHMLRTVNDHVIHVVPLI